MHTGVLSLMKLKWQSILAAAVFLALAHLASPLCALADYKVMLKRGSEFVVPDYEVDKEGVRFWMDGGKVSIPRDKILYISKIREKGPGVSAVVKTIGFGRDSEYAIEDLKSDLKGWDGEQDKALREQAHRLETRYRSAMTEFQTAAQQEDSAQREAAVKQILEIKREKAELAEQAKKLHEGQLPSWWEESAE